MVIPDLWAHWDQVTRVIPWRDSLRALLVYGQRGLRRIASLRKECGVDVAVPRLAETVLEMYTEEQRGVVGHLLESPERLVDLDTYLNHGEGLPLPLLRVELDGFGIPVSGLSGPNLRYSTRIDHEGDMYTNGFVVDPGFRQRTNAEGFIDAALEVELMVQRCDAVLSNTSVPSEIHSAARADLEEITGKRVLLIVE